MGDTLVDKGAAKTDIMISKNAFPSVLLAARELQYCISRMTGCTLPIVESTNQFSGLRIVRTGSALSPNSLSLTPTSLELKQYEYVIQFGEGEIILLGHDARDSTGPKIDYPVVPADASFNFCPCAPCKRLLDPHRNDMARTPTGLAVFNDGRSSELWFTFVNNIARELKKTHPDKFISTLAYETYFLHPTVKLENNVAVAPRLQTRNYWHQTAYENEMKHYDMWVNDKRPIFLWNYHCFPEEPSIPTPRPFLIVQGTPKAELSALVLNPSSSLSSTLCSCC